jgi:hypothetical protein
MVSRKPMVWQINNIAIENIGEELLTLPETTTVLIQNLAGNLYPFATNFFGELYHSFYIYPKEYYGIKLGTNKGQKLFFSEKIAVVKIMRRPAINSFRGLIQNIASKGENCKFLTTLELPQLFFLAKFATNADIHENINSLAITTIKRSCLLLYGVPLIPSMVIKLKFHPDIKKKQVKHLFNFLLRFLPLPNDLKKEILNKLRIVFTKNQTVRDILCNFKTYAKSFGNAPPYCICNTISDNHKIYYPDDLPEEDRDILLQNGSNIPRPKESNQIAEIVAAIQPLIKYLTKINNIYPFPLIQDRNPIPSIMKKPGNSLYTIFVENNMYEMKENRITLLYNIHNLIQPSLKIFAADLYNLCMRYRNHWELDKWNLRQPLISVLNRLYGPFIEYYTTPLRVNSLSLGYFTQKI